MSDKEDTTDEDTGSLEIELEGKIFLVEKDSEGAVTSREEMNGKDCLKVLATVVESCFTSPKLKDILETGRKSIEDLEY